MNIDQYVRGAAKAAREITPEGQNARLVNELLPNGEVRLAFELPGGAVLIERQHADGNMAGRMLVSGVSEIVAQAAAQRQAAFEQAERDSEAAELERQRVLAEQKAQRVAAFRDAQDARRAEAEAAFAPILAAAQ